ncbi:MAG: hypothetical protein WAS32_13285, partial [Tabrizicola sp.]
FGIGRLYATGLGLKSRESAAAPIGAAFRRRKARKSGHHENLPFDKKSDLCQPSKNKTRGGP